MFLLVRYNSSSSLRGSFKNNPKPPKTVNKSKIMKVLTTRSAAAGFFIAFLALFTLTSPMAQANCGGCGDKKEYPSPSPAPKPAK
jgi:hypothetical protein